MYAANGLAVPFYSSVAPSRRRASVRASATTSVARGMAHTLYEVLRVKETASAREIRMAYRNLAKRYHPDAVRQSDCRDFIEIHNAYETLSDPAAREVYDMYILSAAVARNLCELRRTRRAGGFCPTRRWETDQCW